MNVLYDFSCYLKPELENDFDKETDKIKSVIKKVNGVLIEESVPLKKVLSYPVLKYKEGLFFFLKFMAEPKNSEFIKTSLKKEQNILRFLLTRDSYNNKERTPKILKQKPLTEQKKQKSESTTHEQIEEIDKKLEEILGESKN